MFVDIKYCIGDTVCFEYPEEEVVYNVCPCCGGLGSVVGKDGKEYECSECGGDGDIESKTKVLKECHKDVKEIRVDWYPNRKPKVFYKMVGWNWRVVWVEQDKIINKVD